MKHAAEMPDGELARTIVYLGGFTLGVVLVAIAVYLLYLGTLPVEYVFAIIATGLYLMGQGGIATLFVPSIEKLRDKKN